MQESISGAAKQDSSTLGVGQALREAREGMGLTLEDVANRLKFAPNQVAALEQEDFARLPEIAFVRGFVRSYARLLQLDEVSLLSKLPDPRLQEAPAQEEDSVREPFPNIYALRKSNITWLAAGLAVALVLGLFAWLFGGKESEPKVETVSVPLVEPVSAVMDTASASAVPAVESKPAPQEETVVSATAVAANSARRPAPVAASAVHAARPVKPATPAGANHVHQAPQPTAAAGDSALPASHGAGDGEAGSTPLPGAGMATPSSLAAPNTSAADGVSPAATPAGAASAVGESATRKAAAAHSALRLVFDEDSWFEVKDQNGTILLSQLGLRGSERGINRAPPLFVTIGHARGVRVYFKGREVDLGPHTKVDVAHLTLE